jgi:hypothetical protein
MRDALALLELPKRQWYSQASERCLTGVRGLDMKTNEEKVSVEPTPAALRPRLGEWVYVRDLPTPPEVAEAVASYCTRCRYSGRKKQKVEDQFKLAFYYGGRCIGSLQTPRGPAVVLSDHLTQEECAEVRRSLPGRERQALIYEVVPPWDDTPLANA